jgi:hypothetical protein
MVRVFGTIDRGGTFGEVDDHSFSTAFQLKKYKMKKYTTWPLTATKQ